jgi:hypothetical protein
MVRSNLINISIISLLVLLVHALKSVVDVLYRIKAFAKQKPFTLGSESKELIQKPTNLTRVATQPTITTYLSSDSTSHLLLIKDDLWLKLEPLVHKARWCLTMNFDEKPNYHTLFRQTDPDSAFRKWRTSAALYRIRGKSTHRWQHLCSPSS